MTKTKLIGLTVAGLVVGFVAGVLGARQNQSLGAVSYDVQKFVGDVYQGINNTLMMQSGSFVGPISTANTVAISGTTTVSGAFTVSGTAKVSQTTSSTLQIGYVGGGGVGAGCLVLGNSSGATSTPVYITATGSTLSATTTKPTICK